MVNNSKAFVKKGALTTYDQTEQMHMNKRGCPVTPGRRRPSLYATCYMGHTAAYYKPKKRKEKLGI